jgi:hypothetical protein
MFIFYQVFSGSGVHVMFKFYHDFSWVHVKFNFYQVFSGDYLKFRINEPH